MPKTPPQGFEHLRRTVSSRFCAGSKSKSKLTCEYGCVCDVGAHLLRVCARSEFLAQSVRDLSAMICPSVYHSRWPKSRCDFRSAVPWEVADEEKNGVAIDNSAKR